MVECAHGYTAPNEVIRRLSDCQAGEGRHKCAVCAYHHGVEAGAGKRFAGPSQECDQGHATAPLDMLRALPHSQAGPHRHRCAYEAFQAGKETGEARLAGQAEAGDRETIEEERQAAELLASDRIAPTAKEQLILARRGQGVFRRNVLAICHRCPLTGVEDQTMLVASHIKPWRCSSNEERLDGYNGLMLAPHVDHLFDKGWLTFSHDGAVVVSDRLGPGVLDAWALAGSRVATGLNPRHEPYLDYHRREIFRD